MRERERGIVFRYGNRMWSELARSHLKEIFYFLQHGLENTSAAEDQGKALEFQKAIRDILTSTFKRELPEKSSIEVFEKILNAPAPVIPYKCARSSIKVRNDHPMTGGEELEGRRDLVVCFDFNEDYLKSLALMLKRCLTDFYRDLFPPGFSDDVKLIDICARCGEVFLKNKSHQSCCSRICTNKHYYAQKRRDNPTIRKQRAAEMRGRRKATALASRPRSPGWSIMKEMAEWNRKHRSWQFVDAAQFQREWEKAQADKAARRKTRARARGKKAK